MTDCQSLIEEEIFAISHSGEMPEVALHTALYDLQEASAGPRLRLASEDIEKLKDAVEQRYQRILLRDLNPRFRDRSIYRGIARAIASICCSPPERVPPACFLRSFRTGNMLYIFCTSDEIAVLSLRR